MMGRFAGYAGSRARSQSGIFDDPRNLRSRVMNKIAGDRVQHPFLDCRRQASPDAAHAAWIGDQDEFVSGRELAPALYAAHKFSGEPALCKFVLVRLTDRGSLPIRRRITAGTIIAQIVGRKVLKGFTFDKGQIQKFCIAALFVGDKAATVADINTASCL